MKVLQLEGNTLGLDAARVIAEALKEKPEFEVHSYLYVQSSALQVEKVFFEKLYL